MFQKTKPYPRAFWLLFVGFIINRTSTGLIWPFLALYMREQLNAPLSTITLLFSIQSVAGLLSTSVVGSFMDRFGRKLPIILSMLAGSAVLIAMRSATTLEVWAVLIALYGMFIPVFTVGGNAMVADLVEEEKRSGAYALIRTAQNVGVAVGPAIGGFLVVNYYGLTYIITAAVYIVLAVLIMFILPETLTRRKNDEPARTAGGYGEILRDRAFMSLWLCYLLIEMVITLVFILLPVYTKENFRIAEDQYGLLVTINAAMVVFFQYAMTRFTIRYRDLHVLVLGSLVYAAGILSVAFGSTFAAFAASMVVITIGELMIAPTGLSLVSRLAPADKRARYMGLFSLTWTVAAGTAPFIGGLLNDYASPAAIWYGGAVMGLAAAAGFYLMAQSRVIEMKNRPAPVGSGD